MGRRRVCAALSIVLLLGAPGLGACADDDPDNIEQIGDDVEKEVEEGLDKIKKEVEEGNN